MSPQDHPCKVHLEASGLRSFWPLQPARSSELAVSLASMQVYSCRRAPRDARSGDGREVGALKLCCADVSAPLALPRHCLGVAAAAVTHRCQAAAHACTHENSRGDMLTHLRRIVCAASCTGVPNSGRCTFGNSLSFFVAKYAAADARTHCATNARTSALRSRRSPCADRQKVPREHDHAGELQVQR